MSMMQMLLGVGGGGSLDLSGFIKSYAGTGSAKSETTGMSLTDGGLIWIKAHANSNRHKLIDTIRGAGWNLTANQDLNQTNETTGLTAFNSDGFSLGGDSEYNGTSTDYFAFTFPVGENFFDIVDYDGDPDGIDNTNPRAISHNLGTKPGFIIVKRYDDTGHDWIVWHTSLSSGDFLKLNGTALPAGNSGYFTTTIPTASNFYVGDNVDTNGDGKDLIAYLFAEDSEYVKCGKYTASGSSLSVTLGFEPQWVMLKALSNSSQSNNWFIHFPTSHSGFESDNAILKVNTSDSASNYGVNGVTFTSTGFSISGGAFTDAGDWGYVAIAAAG